MAEGTLAGRRVLVTGAAGGIGAAVVRRILRDGGRVAASDLPGTALEGLSSLTGDAGTLVLVPADVRDEAAVAQACATACEAFGGLDGLCTAAGVLMHGRDAPVDELDRAVWDELFAINTTGTFLACKHALPALRLGGGSIVMISSAAGLYGDRESHGYAASKGALLALTRSIAQRYGPEGVRAVAVCPGFVETAMTREFLADPDAAAAITGSTALRRVADTSEVAGAVTFLLSGDASFISSTTIEVHGGLVK